jgi:hypothetical protein
MSVYVLTPLAKANIFEIWCHIAENSESDAGSEGAACQIKTLARTDISRSSQTTKERRYYNCCALSCTAALFV